MIRGDIFRGSGRMLSTFHSRTEHSTLLKQPSSCKRCSSSYLLELGLRHPYPTDTLPDHAAAGLGEAGVSADRPSVGGVTAGLRSVPSYTHEKHPGL
jgi:hypothetical protein